MPVHRLMQPAAFDATAVKIITTAFDDALQATGLARTDPEAEIIARKIIECARHGELDPDRLCALATASYRM
jgi:hypothetical protein